MPAPPLRGCRLYECRFARTLARPSRTHADAVVQNGYRELVAQPSRSDLNIARASPGADTVSDSILHQGLEQEARDKRGANAVLDVAAHGETVLKSHPLDRHVAVEKSELALERHFLLARSG